MPYPRILVEMLEFLCFFEKNMKNHEKNQNSKMTFFMIHIDRNIVEPVGVAETQPLTLSDQYWLG